MKVRALFDFDLRLTVATAVVYSWTKHTAKLSAPRRISFRASGGVICFMGGSCL